MLLHQHRSSTGPAGSPRVRDRRSTRAERVNGTPNVIAGCADITAGSMAKKEGYARLETDEDADADAGGGGGFVGGGPSPELRAGFLSWSAIIFSWMTPLVRQGSVEPLQLEHLSQLNPQDTSAAVSARFQAEWAKELERRPAEPSLKRAMYLTFGRPWVKAGLFKLVHDIMAFGGPVFLDLLLQYLVRAQTEETSLLEGIAYAAGLFWTAQIQSICEMRSVFPPPPSFRLPFAQPDAALAQACTSTSTACSASGCTRACRSSRRCTGSPCG